ncbi:YceI family protein [Ideonella sp.]|uniref:YceI family protein n=1 Tax=Ideonella sp. TaxID=1929293 RepID=UPI0035B018EA
MSALTRSAALAATLLLGSSLALAQAQKVVPAQSEIGFTSKQMGVPVDGKFRKWDATISFDPKKPEASNVSFTIDTGSAGFGSPETDAEVPKPAWFNVAKFPQATFQSSGMKALGGGKFEVAGKLTIKGSVKDVVVPVALAQGTGGVTFATGAFTIKRLDFKIGEGEWADTSMVANDVQVRFKLAVTGVAPL